jgi:CheY-like chemotaxis protein
MGQGNQGTRILFVEDHHDTAVTLAKLLEQRGHRVRVASSVAEALDAAAREPFELLICDIGLPDGSGCDVMQRLRENGTIRKGIALTAHGMVEDVRHSYDAGFLKHITKPIPMDTLESSIQEVMAADVTILPPTTKPASVPVVTGYENRSSPAS